MCTDDEMIINKCRKYLHKTKNDIGNPYFYNGCQGNWGGEESRN
jgi:hypothetical protein